MSCLSDRLKVDSPFSPTIRKTKMEKTYIVHLIMSNVFAVLTLAVALSAIFFPSSLYYGYQYPAIAILALFTGFSRGHYTFERYGAARGDTYRLRYSYILFGLFIAVAVYYWSSQEMIWQPKTTFQYVLSVGGLALLGLLIGMVGSRIWKVDPESTVYQW